MKISYRRRCEEGNTDKKSNCRRNFKHFNTRERMAQNKIDVYDLA